MLVGSTDDDVIQAYTVGDGDLSEVSQNEDDDNDPTTPDVSVNIGKEDTLFPSLGLAASPGQFLYSATSHGVIEQFRIKRSGELDHLNPETAPLSNGLGGIAVTPNGLHAYATSSPNKIKQYDISPGGTLSPKDADADSGNQPADIKVSPNGQFAYVANLGDGTISQYSVGTDGVLHPLSTPTATAPSGPQGLLIDSTGTYLYAACPDAGKIAIYAIGADGRLTHQSDANSPQNAQSVAISLSGFAYSGNSQGTAQIVAYTVGAGSLTQFDTASPIHSNPARLYISPENFLYVCYSDDSRISVYRINADGTLALRDTESTVHHPGPAVFRYLP